MPVAAVFDMDGTLVTFEFDVKGTREAIFETLGAMGYDTSALGVTAPTQKILDAVREQSGTSGEERYVAARSKIFSILDSFEERSAPRTVTMAGVRDVLRLLLSKGVRLAVLTNAGRGSVAGSLGRQGLTGFFEFILTRDDTLSMKPRPEGLLMAVERLGLPKGSVTYVGDSLLDVQAARDAGVRLVSVATGHYSRERLVAGGAENVISALDELPNALGL